MIRIKEIRENQEKYEKYGRNQEIIEIEYFHWILKVVFVDSQDWPALGRPSGSDRSLESIKPHFQNSGKKYAFIFKKLRSEMDEIIKKYWKIFKYLEKRIIIIINQSLLK